MGSFSQTCAISRLPIEYSDKIKVLLLMEYPYEYANCNKPWIIRSIPIDAEYNDYGSFESNDKIKEESWIQSLNDQIVECGWGENTCHDVPVHKNMTFEAFKEALWEDRVKIYSKKINEENTELKKIQDKIISYGFQLFKNYGDNNYIVTSLCDNVFVVRTDVFESEKNLEKLKELIPYLEKDYAVMLTSGVGNYADVSRYAELTIRKKPGVRTFKSYSEKNLNIRLAMIRQDVWDSLIKFKPKYPQYFGTIEKYCEEIEKFTNPKLNPILNLGKYYPFDELNYRFLSKGLGFAIECARNNGKNEEEIQQERKRIIQELGELAYIEEILSNSRIPLYPSLTYGPQYGCWDTCMEVNKIFFEVSEMNIRKQNEEADEEE